MKELIGHDEISRQQYDNAVAAESAAQAAHSHVEQARAQVRAAHTAPEHIAISKAGSAEAVVEERRAVVDRASFDLDYSTVKAPINGIASQRNVQLGEVIFRGQPLLALADLDSLWCIANCKETQLKQMKVGRPARIHVDAYDTDFTGRVDAFGGATGSRFSVLPPVNATGNFAKVAQHIPVRDRL
jgi:membrane fusion protein, multidrug efflux system